MTARLVTAALTLVGALVGAAAGITADPAGGRAATLQAWKERQTRVTSAKFVITETSTIGRGTQTSPRARQQGRTYPPEDVTYETPVVIAFDGGKLRYAFKAKSWSEEKQKYLPHDYLAAFNGTDAKMLISPGRDEFYKGRIGAKSQHDDVGNYHLFPVLFAYRAVDPTMSLIAQKELIDQPRTEVDRRECAVYLVGRPAKGQETRVYVDPARGHSVVRYTHTSNGKLRLKIDVSYREDPAFGFVPAAWEIAVKPDDAPQYFSAVVKEASLNQAIDPGYFEIDFPPGSMVADYKAKPPKEYIIRLDRSVRPIPPEDAGASFDELVRTEPGDAIGTVPPSRVTTWVLSAVGVAALIAGWWLVRRRRAA